EEYTLTDLSTYLSLPSSYQDRVQILKVGSDNPDDPLLLPGYLLIGTRAKNKVMAREFAEWAAGPLGQEVVRVFMKGGRQLYSPAPVRDSESARTSQKSGRAKL